MVIVSDNDRNGKLEIAVLMRHRISVLEGTTLTGITDIPLKPDGLKISVYPNPFNPTTEIEFEIPDKAPVNLEVFNILGVKVEKPIDNSEFEPGKYNYRWNGKDKPTGVYFFRLSQGEKSITKRVVYLK